MNKCEVEVVQTSSEFWNIYDYFFSFFRFDIKYRLRGSNIQLLLVRTPNDVKLAAVLTGSAVVEKRLPIVSDISWKLFPMLAGRCVVATHK